MTQEQILISAVLFLTLAMFAWGRWRHDLVAMAALVICGILSLVPMNKLFLGFGHPAVITVAAVLIISHALKNAGVVDVLSSKLDGAIQNQFLHIGVLTLVVTVASAFMNNVGALALMLPVAIATANKQNRSPAMILMPLAFGSILGGMTTMIGTPPNIIVATFRESLEGAEPFGLFDFSPVGVPVAFFGVLFVITLGWRFLPKERLSKNAGANLFEVGQYLLELKILEDSKLVNADMRTLVLDDDWELRLMGIARSNRPPKPLAGGYRFRVNDILVVHGKAEEVKPLLEDYGLELQNARGVKFDELKPEDIKLFEGVVAGNSPLIGRGLPYLRRRSLGTMSLIGLSRHGETLKKRLRRVTFQAGDILLLEGKADEVDNNISMLGLLPLAKRELSLDKKHRATLALIVFAIAISLGLFKLLPLFVAFLLAIFAYILLNILPVRDIYNEVDWPVIVLLGAMIPVGQALDSTGTTALLAENIVKWTGNWDILWVITLILVVTIFLSDIINNAATVLVMAPISISIADKLSSSSDPFLMAVAVGASCAFLTPIGHQSNTLVMGPGGYKFSDYWRMGLPLEVIIVIVSVPLILWAWPP